jgi:hypothetical protein
MNARLYDPVLGRFLSPDPYVQAPDYSQNFNRYSYALNNPLIYTDESGEFLHILIPAIVGVVVNVVSGLISGEIRDIGDGFAYFGIGAAAGVATLYGGTYAGAAVLGFGNNAWNQFDRNGYSFNNFDWGESMMSTFTSVATAYIADAMNSYLSGPLNGLTKNIASPVIREGVKNGLTNGITGFTLSGAIALSNEETRGDWLKHAARGGIFGTGMGITTGVATGYKYARDNGYDPWTGNAILGAQLRSVEDVMFNPSLLQGKTPYEVEAIIGNTSGWRVEALGRGDHKGEGWLLREYLRNGKPSGRMIRYHPGGGHHGPYAYWSVHGYNGRIGERMYIYPKPLQ